MVRRDIELEAQQIASVVLDVADPLAKLRS
jgi:hypothetical protein